jgi:hypothetical protein
MRQSFMFIQDGFAIYMEDVEFGANLEPWDCGACRRR